MHNYRNKAHGDPYYFKGFGKVPLPETERFWAKVDKSGDCWTWTAYVNPKGYGKFNTTAGKLILAHRFSYSEAFGPLPDGMEIDHLCFTRNCIRPSHLEAVPHAENIRRAVERLRAAKLH